MRKAPSLLLLCCLLPILALVRHAAPSHSTVPRSAGIDYTRYVNPLIGTAGDGNVFPGATVPFGMVQWSPDTSSGGLFRSSGYSYPDPIITGFSLSHISGAGCASFGNFPILPTIRPIRSAMRVNGSPYSDRFSHAGEQVSPGYYRTRLTSGIVTELTNTVRTGFGSFNFPRTRSSSVLISAGTGAGAPHTFRGPIDGSVGVAGSNELVGSATGGHFCGLTNHYTVYFAARFNRPFQTFGTWSDRALARHSRHARGSLSGAFVSFDTSHDPVVKVKVGISYVSVGNARLNLMTENRGWDFAAVRRGARATWNDALRRIEVGGGTSAQKTVFYTALYHSLLHPNVFNDVNGTYRGFDSRVHVARGYTQYANFSGWDIYRAEVPLLALLVPRRTGDMMESLLSDARQGGWLPKWPIANDYTGEMNGDPADPMIAGAYAFGARHFDAAAALKFMLKGASQPGTGPHGYEERPGLQSYLRDGYIAGYNPPEIRPYGAAATTLEYAIDDFALAQLARSLHHPAVYATFMNRSRTWRKLFDPGSKLIKPRLDSGHFPTPFDPSSLDGYVEGDAWQYLWGVPHDLPYLFRRLGGQAVVVKRLDRFFSGRFDTGPATPYYWAGNETDLQAPWEYDFAGRPDRTQEIVRKILLNRYTTTVGGLPGNDDLGGLSSWAVWAMVGMYPEIPGTDILALGSPLFPRVTIHLSGGHHLRILAPGASGRTPRVRAVHLNGRPVRAPWLHAAGLSRGATLRFTMLNHWVP